MAFADWLGIETRSEVPVEPSNPSPLPGVLPPRPDATPMGLNSALGLTSVYRSMFILSTTVMQLELGVWRKEEELDTPALVRQPNAGQYLSQFLKRTVIGLAGDGNAYWRVYSNPDGSPASLEALNPLVMHVGIENGKKVFDFGGDEFQPPARFRADQIKHLRLLEIPGRVKGLGPIEANRVGLAGSADLRSYSSGWFRNGGVPTGVLSTDQNLTPADADAYKARWNETQEQRGVAVLGKGLSYSSIMISPADAMFIESSQFNVTDVARLFGIPANYLLAEVNGNSMTYSNLEQVDTQFVRTTLLAYLKEIEDALSSLLPRGQRARFKLDGLLRPDTKTLSDVHKTYHEIGALTVDEIRKDKGWKALPAQEEVPTDV